MQAITWLMNSWPDGLLSHWPMASTLENPLICLCSPSDLIWLSSSLHNLLLPLITLTIQVESSLPLTLLLQMMMLRVLGPFFPWAIWSDQVHLKLMVYAVLWTGVFKGTCVPVLYKLYP